MWWRPASNVGRAWVIASTLFVSRARSSERTWRSSAAKSPPSNLCGSGAVGHVDLQAKVYPNIFARNLREEKGYATGLFGKCMNGGCLNPASMHGAFDRWFEGTHFYGGNWYDDGTYWNSTTYGGGYGTRYIRTHESIAIDEVHRRGSSHTTPCGVVLWYSIIMY